MSPPKISRKTAYRAPSHPQVPTSWAARSTVKKKSRWRLPRLIGLVIILAGVASLSATAGALLAVSLSVTPLQQHPLARGNKAVFRQDQPMSSGGTLRLPHLTRPVNILVMGIKVITADLKEVPPELRHLSYQALVNSFDGLADSMLLVRFNPQTQQVVVLSLPRDTRTYVQGRLTKLNEANPQGGPALTAESVSDLLGGIAIDRYVRINVQGVGNLIDALGGITVTVPQNMKYRDDSQHFYVDLKAGKQLLNGEKALQFLRFRYDANGDIGRIQRQQMFMRALAEQTLNPTTITRLPKILSVIQSNVDTNLSVEELMALLGYSAQINRANVQMLMLPGSFSTRKDFSLSYWLPNYSEIDSLVKQYFSYGGQPITSGGQPQQVRIAIQDSINNPEAVQRLKKTLRESGYIAISVDKPIKESLPITRVVAQQGDRTTAEMIQRFLGVGEALVESTGALNSDITIQLGQDWAKVP